MVKLLTEFEDFYCILENGNFISNLKDQKLQTMQLLGDKFSGFLLLWRIVYRGEVDCYRIEKCL